jgi:hypothetical protein
MLLIGLYGLGYYIGFENERHVIIPMPEHLAKIQLNRTLYKQGDLVEFLPQCFFYHF